jgi:hypothetical protein
VAAVDTSHPDLDLSDATLDPDPGTVFDGCSATFTMSGVHVTDPAFSSGIEFVGFKYRIPGLTSLTLGPEFTKDSGGMTLDGAWDAMYSGTLTVTVPGSGDYEIQLYVKHTRRGTRKSSPSGPTPRRELLARQDHLPGSFKLPGRSLVL